MGTTAGDLGGGEHPLEMNGKKIDVYSAGVSGTKVPVLKKLSARGVFCTLRHYINNWSIDFFHFNPYIGLEIIEMPGIGSLVRHPSALKDRAANVARAVVVLQNLRVECVERSARDAVLVQP